MGSLGYAMMLPFYKLYQDVAVLDIWSQQNLQMKVEGLSNITTLVDIDLARNQGFGAVYYR